MSSSNVYDLYLMYSILKRSQMFFEEEISQIIANLIFQIEDVNIRDNLCQAIIEYIKESDFSNEIRLDELDNIKDTFSICREAILNNKKLKIRTRYHGGFRIIEKKITPIWFGCPYGRYSLIYTEEGAIQYSSLYLSLIENVQIIDEDGDVRIIIRHSLDEFIGIPWYPSGDKVTIVKVKVNIGSDVDAFFQRRIKRKYCKKLASNSVFATYELQTNGLENIKRWLLALGQDVEVLEPTSLRNEMRDMIKNMCSIYWSSQLRDGNGR